MIPRAVQKNKKTFDDLLLEAIKESLSILLDRSSSQSFFIYLKKNNNVSEEDISKNLTLFSTELDRLFGVNASQIKKLITVLLYSKLGLDYREKPDYALEEYVTEARAKDAVNIEVNGDKPVLNEKELRVVRSLGQDARKPVTLIAKETGLSRPTVTNMISRMTEQGLLQIKAGLDIKELGFPTACLAMECKLPETRRELTKTLSICPRVLLVLEISEKVNLLLLLYGEDPMTLKSTIESFRNLPGASLDDIYHSGPPMVTTAFNVPIFTEKSDVAPCGKTCGGCVNYLDNECCGCPAVKEYKGPF